MWNVGKLENRLFIFSLQLFITYIYKFLYYNVGISGIYLTIKGKIGRAGSVRKNKFIIGAGNYHFLNYKLHLNYKSNYVASVAGSAGIKVIILY